MQSLMGQEGHSENLDFVSGKEMDRPIGGSRIYSVSIDAYDHWERRKGDR